MISIAGHDMKPQHLPVGSLKIFGCNPYDESMFRVVWSESRYYLVGGNHTNYKDKDIGPSPQRIVDLHDGSDPNVAKAEVGYRWLPLYPGVKAWILERWLSPFAFTGCSKEQWDRTYTDPSTKLLTLGPYPSRGEFAHCFTFPSIPGISVVHGVINRIRAGSKYNFADHQRALKEEQEKKKKSDFNVKKDIFLDSQQAFKNRPSNVRPGKRTKSDVKLVLTADQVGLNQHGFSAGTHEPRR